MSNFFSGKRGFTLIELLIVIAIIGILASGVMIVLNPGAQMAKARDATRRSDANQLVSAIKRYYIANGKYPDATDCLSNWCESINGGVSWIPDLATSGEVEKLPRDPINKSDSSVEFQYYYISNGSDYCLQIGLETDASSDPNDMGWGKTRSAWRLRYGPSLPHAVGSLCLTR